MSATDSLLLLIFPALMAYAAASDLVTMTIPNRLSLLLIAGFFGMAVITGMSWQAVGLHLSAGFVVLLVTFGMFAFGWIGGGDAKLAAATGIWCGFATLTEYLLFASLLGGALTMLIILWRTTWLPEFAMKINWISKLHHTKTGIPYGIALAASGLLVYPYTPIWQAVVVS